MLFMDNGKTFLAKHRASLVVLFVFTVTSTSFVTCYYLGVFSIKETSKKREQDKKTAMSVVENKTPETVPPSKEGTVNVLNSKSAAKEEKTKKIGKELSSPSLLKKEAEKLIPVS